MTLVLILLGICATIARSGSRGGFIGLLAVAGTALFLVNTVSVSRRATILVVALVALEVGAPPGYWKQMGTVLEPKEDYNFSTQYGRKALAQRGLGYMLAYPVFGVGIHNFARAECSISPILDTLKKYGPMRCRPPHNSYIEAGAEIGIPGMIAWVSIVVGVVVSLLRLRRRLPQAWRNGTESERFMYGATTFFPLSMVGFAVTAFFVTFAWMDPIYILAAFTAGLVIAIRAHIREELKKPTQLEVSPVTTAERPRSGWRVSMSARARASMRTARYS